MDFWILKLMQEINFSLNWICFFFFFWEEDCALGYKSMNFSDFPNIS